MTSREATRPATAGELCTCGREAITVYEGGRYGDTGHCGRSDGGLPKDGTCSFCGDEVDHEHYGRAERAAGRDSAAGGDGPQGGRCPAYRLRLADPPPELHPGSVRRFDPAADRVTRAGHRLAAELRELLLVAGHDTDEADISATVTADYVAEVVTAAGDRDPDGLLAVTAMLAYLVEDFDELAVAPNPAAVSGYVLAAAIGPCWHDTTVLRRPLLAAQHLHAHLLRPTTT